MENYKCKKMDTLHQNGIFYIISEDQVGENVKASSLEGIDTIVEPPFDVVGTQYISEYKE